MSLVAIAEADYVTVSTGEELDDFLALGAQQREKLLADLEEQMRDAARKFEFERAAQLRDRIKAWRTREVYGEAAPDSPGGGGTG
jgi:excinuclease ABC subunit B